MGKKGLYLFFIITSFLILIPFISADFGYDNPTLPHLTPEAEVTINKTYYNLNSSEYWITDEGTLNNVVDILGSWLTNDLNWITNAVNDLVNYYTKTEIENNYVPYTGADKNLDLGNYNVTASWFKGKFNWSVGDLFATFDGSTWLQNVSKVNQTIDERIAVTYYNATSIDIIAGTDNTNELSALQTYNGITYNISEATGTPAMDVRINFTGVADFNQLVVRMRTTSGGRHRYKIQIYDYNEVIWEDYTNFVEVDTFKVMDLGVYDPEDHISGGLVQVRFYLDEAGIPAHELFLDWVGLSDGPTTFTTSEIDPLSYHKNENINMNNYNITDINYLKLTNSSTIWNMYVDVNGTLVWEQE